jgi:hypothetical protein
MIIDDPEKNLNVLVLEKAPLAKPPNARCDLPARKRPSPPAKP